MVGAVGVALLGFAAPALASDITPAPEGRTFEWSVNAAITSDYIFRGVSQTDNDPAISAGADFSYGILYAGFWASNVDESVSPDNFEIDYYAGIKPVLGPATFDFGILYYTYPGKEVATGEVETVELKAGVSGDILPKLSGGAVVYWSPEAGGGGSEYWVYEGTLAYSLPKFLVFDPSISGTLGYFDDVDIDSNDYTYWNAGLSFGYDKFTFDFRYWDTDISGTSGYAAEYLADERFVFTAKIAYP
jgi:uncharacterized protein (TIGR02001 family)